MPASPGVIVLSLSDNRAGPSNLGNVISQILLCKQITPDFHQEELCSIDKDSQEISKIIKEMQEYMPKQENNLGECVNVPSRNFPFCNDQFNRKG